MHPWEGWDHVLKIDPDKTLVDGETYDDVAGTGTDAVAVGGTTGMTPEKMNEVIDGLAPHDVPVFIEPSHGATVVHPDALDGYLIPVVFNAGSVAWLTGFHKEWVRLDGEIDWDRTATEAYIVLNPDSSAAKYTEADCDLRVGDVAAYATVAERMFGQRIVYVEYSGTYGDPELVAAAGDALDEATLFYGGGIHDYDSARRMAEVADVVVVGDLVHEVGVDAVAETVRGAGDAGD